MASTIDDADKNSTLERQLREAQLLNEQLLAQSVAEHQARLKAEEFVQRRTFPFEKLPPELRKVIYGMTMSLDKTITISRRRLKEPNGDSPFALDSRVHDERQDGKVKRKLPEKLFGLSMLRVNKLTHSEAMPLLYFNNDFVLMSASSLAKFLTDAGPRIRFVRSIRPQHWSRSIVHATKLMVSMTSSRNSTCRLIALMGGFS